MAEPESDGAEPVGTSGEEATDEGNRWYDEGLAAEFNGLVDELAAAVGDGPARLSEPREYVSKEIGSSLDWNAVSGEGLRNVFATEFECDTMIGLAVRTPTELPLSQEDMREHARQACRIILDLEVLARAASEEDLADRALGLAARYASFYGVSTAGRTRTRQVELGLVREN